MPTTNPAFAYRSRTADALPVQARVERARRMPRPAGAPPPVAVLMAERLMHHEQASGAGTDADLRRDGFTVAEIHKLGDEARDIAAARAVRRMLDQAA